ncbi:hypothetical protein [Chamaesiphon polymorphus]|uniref:Uncharacterized protein n=1 Tax=Chamaesiphon polymorphus CCALA 037 TaxID=2107692 RepID=A0A2T1G3N7_9CYAN|nr:hypothetical protein [Chamaesiphon polymorphus]PSB51868.1 hypothetical protein C7B77_21090 [Chamaesiphon polymorphus CCALA 037]
MKLIILLATATLGIWIAQPVRAATTREVYNIAKSVTARIDVSQNGQSIDTHRTQFNPHCESQHHQHP